MTEPPSYNTAVASDGTRYYFFDTPGDITRPKRTLSIKRTDTTRARPEKAYHVVFQEWNHLQIVRGEDEFGAVVANVAVLNAEPICVDITFASGAKASIDVDDVRKVGDKEKKNPPINADGKSDVNLEGKEETRQRLPIKLIGDHASRWWDMARKVSEPHPGRFLKRSTPAKEEDMDIRLEYFEGGNDRGRPSAIFVNTVVGNKKL
jgi:hypothetical protein